MKKSIIGLVLVSVMAFGNTLLAIGTGTSEWPRISPQVSNYCIVVTNYTMTYKTVGNRPTGCNQMGCLVYHYEPILSDTNYVETETVNKKTMLSYDVTNIKGETCIKDEVVSKRKREVNQVSTMKTNDWREMEAVSWENIRGYLSITNTIINATLASTYKDQVSTNAVDTNKVWHIVDWDYIKKDMIHSPNCPCHKKNKE